MEYLEKELWKYKILQTVAIAIIGLMATIAVVFLQEYAVVGGDVMSQGQPRYAQMAILLSYSLSSLFLWFLTIVGTIALVASIWWDNITTGTKWLYEKAKIAARGASTELQKE